MDELNGFKVGPGPEYVCFHFDEKRFCWFSVGALIHNDQALSHFECASPGLPQ